MTRQPLENQTLYAELLEQLLTWERLRSIGSLEGSFVSKQLKGERYLYFQYYEPGGAKRQLYVGRQTPELDALAAAYRAERQALADDLLNIQRLAAQLRVGGALLTDHPSARVIRQMAESGVFRLGGVLVGTHAYVVLGNLLGMVWEHAATRTRDIDIAAGRGPVVNAIAFAIPPLEVDLPAALDSLKMGFFPIPQLDCRRPSTSFMIRGNVLRVDILTPAIKQQRDEPIYIPRFKVAAQPLPFLDYLIEAAVPAVVVDGGGILVNVPHPARYAVHKLIVAQERSVESQAKKHKDIFQSWQLLAFLKAERPGDIPLALESATSRGPGWRKRIDAGLAAIQEQYGWTI
jgi:hypothetical protein